MKKRGLFAALLGIVLAFSMLLAACQETASPKVEVETGGVPLGQFEITAPALDSTDEDVNPRISWTQEPNAEEYLVQLSESADFSAVAAEERTERTHTAIGTTLKYSTKYYVRIFAMKEQDGKDIALSYASTAFTTQADHETPVPDNTVTRVIHDFEDFEDDDELQSFFTTHTGGDSLVPTLAEGEGADGSTAMKLTYTPEGRGWSAVQSINPADKKNWSGATGIRLWVSGTKGTLKVSIGKRGYQRWTAGFSLDAGEAGYVSIPFSAFEDSGGGDGVWDMTGIVRLWFYFNASSAAEVLIDNVTIGSDALHSQDTREQFEQGTVPDYSTPKTLYDFETFADDTALQGEFYANAGGDPLNVTLAKGQGANGTAAMKVEYGAKSKGWCALQSRLTDIESNWTGAEGIRFWISGGGNGAQLTLQVGQGTAIDLRAQLTLNATEGMYVSIPFSAFTVNAGSLNLSNVNVLWIRIAPSSVSTGDYFLIDDISIGTGTDYNTDTRAAVETVPVVPADEGVYEDFESYSDIADMGDKFGLGNMQSSSIVTSGAYGGSKMLSVVPNGASVSLRINLTAKTDFTDIASFRFKATPGSYAVQFISGTNVMSKAVTVVLDGESVGVNLNELALRDPSSMQMALDEVDYIQIVINGKNGQTVYFDDIEFSADTYTAPTSEYGKPRTLYDFETFTDDAALQSEFYANTGGNPITVTLAEGQGAGGTAAMKVELGENTKGWAALQARLSGGKNVWTGAEGIRFWINGGGNGVSVTLRIGDNTNDLRAQFTLNASEGMYVSIPFSAFTVNAGNLPSDLSNISVLWLYVSGTQGSSFLIDDISIGTGTDYNTDTRDAVTNPPKEGAEGIFEDFDSYSDVSEVSGKWTTTGPAGVAFRTREEGNNVLRFYATGEFSTQASGYNLAMYDFTEINGFRMWLNLTYGGDTSSATVTVTIGSEGNYYTVNKLFFAPADNNAEYMVCDFAGMTLASGSEGDLDKSKIDFLQITVGGFTGAVDFRIDELEFYTEQVGAKGAAFTSDFSDDTTQNWGSAVLANGTATVSTANTSASLQYTNSSWTNYQNTYALRFKVKTENVVSISVRTLNGSGNGKSQVVSVGTDDEYEFIVYYDQMDVRNSLYTSMKFYYIQMYITFGSGGGSVEFTSVELLIG